jgi:(p)ppGpp synthase/HD superfamily hydrolase
MNGEYLRELAHHLAYVKHDGTSRKGTGEPYINHVVRVADRCYGWKAKTVAYLHDLVEDTNIDLDTLERIGFPTEIIDVVDALSRREDETYKEFIHRIKEAGSLAVEVKLADLADNLQDIEQIPNNAGLRKRYINATACLLNDKDE